MLVFIAESFLKKGREREKKRGKIYEENGREITQQFMDLFSSYLTLVKRISNIQRRIGLEKGKVKT